MHVLTCARALVPHCFTLYGTSLLTPPPPSHSATALFLASKTENHYISIERYAAALATECDIPDLDGRTIVQLEYTLADTICFHLAVHHPLTALHGIFLDAQAYVAEERHAMLLSAYRAAAAPAAMVDVLADTDLYFLCHPSQIAMAMFCRAYDRQVDVRFANGGDAQGLVEGVANSTVDADADAHSFTASYIRKRFAKEDPSHLDELLLKITAIYQHLDAIPSRHPDPLAMKLIEERAAYWRLPSLDPQSRVYATRQHGDEEHEMREVLPTSSTTATTRTDRRRSTVAQELDDVFE